MSNEVYYQGHRPEMLPFLPNSPKHVLEIGCADGSFSTSLSSYQEYWGVEPVDKIAEQAKQRISHVLVGTFDEVYSQLPDQYFDCIICNDVIEHLPDHEQFLNKIKSKMTKDACLVGSIPNVRYVTNLMALLFSRDWQYEDDGILDRTHLRFFTEKSLKKVFKEAGYQPTLFSGINPIKKKVFPLSRLWKNFIILLLGSDARYMQFGFQCKLK